MRTKCAYTDQAEQCVASKAPSVAVTTPAAPNCTYTHAPEQNNTHCNHDDDKVRGHLEAVVPNTREKVFPEALVGGA